MRYEIPMTLTVEADDERQAHWLAVRFERTRETFALPYEWLHVGLTPRVEDMLAGRREQLAGNREQHDDDVDVHFAAAVDEEQVAA
jgi:hypothetical protein